MAIRIITDSTSDISQNEAKSLGITVIPMPVLWGDKIYEDGIDINADDFYQMLTTSPILPTTSQLTPANFMPHFQAARDAGDSVIVMVISSGLSNTVNNAITAKELCGYDDIHIVDSKYTIMGLRLLVEYAVQLANEGKTALQIVAMLENARDRVLLLGIVDTLEYLHKGGRLSAAGAAAGTLLNIKPIITFNNSFLENIGKSRGTAKAIQSITDIIGDGSNIDHTVPVYFGYAEDLEKGLAFKEKMVSKYDLTNTKMVQIGSVVGTHVGPGAVVITILRKSI